MTEHATAHDGILEYPNVFDISEVIREAPEVAIPEEFAHVAPEEVVDAEEPAPKEVYSEEPDPVAPEEPRTCRTCSC